MTAAPRLRAGLMPVPVMGMVAKCTKYTANPMGSGTSACNGEFQHVKSSKSRCDYDPTAI